MSETRVYAVASGKGGVGKTTTAAALGACAAAAGRSAVVVDADLGMGNLAAAVGLDDAAPTLHDVLAGAAAVDDAVHETTGGFDVVPGGAVLEDYADADPAELGDVVAALRERYDIVVLDTGAGLSHDTVLPLGLADAVVLVTTPAAMAVENTRTTADVADRLGAAVAGVVVTQATGGVEDVEETLDAPLLGTVPRDGAVGEAADAGEPVPVAAPQSPAALAYAELAADLLAVPVGSLELPGDPDVGGDAPAAAAGGPSASVPDPPVEAAEGGSADDGDETGTGAGDGDADGGESTADGDRSDGAAGDGAERGGGADDGTGGAADGDADADAEESRSVLSRLTGGLLG